MKDNAFQFSREGLTLALQLLEQRPAGESPELPDVLPSKGLGNIRTLETLAPRVLGGARELGGPLTFAHMDPPTPWITWAVTQWNAALNQNLLHPDTAPAAIEIERRVVDWLAPLYGMDGGHMTPGASVANLTALWAARESAGVRRVLASEAAHLSVAKAAHILGLEFECIPVDAHGKMQRARLPDDLGDACIVLTAGTTGAGAIDSLGKTASAAWTHVDAAWGGALRISQQYATLLDGIETADSVCVSAHKWFFQPKESALVLFRDTTSANRGIQFEGAYLATPNIGVQGSHGACALPLLATLLAWGREGLAARIEQCMDDAGTLAGWIHAHQSLELFTLPESGIVLWRAASQTKTDALFRRLPNGLASRVGIDGYNWIRNVAANPNADIDALTGCIQDALDACE